MKIIAFALALLSAQAFAAPVSFQYTSGSLVGRSATANPNLVGYEDICFRGDVNAAAGVLYRLLDADAEKVSVFVRPVRSEGSIAYGYTSTKCLDDGDADLDCREVRIARACR